MTGRTWWAALWVGAGLCLALPAFGDEPPPLETREVGTLTVHKPKDMLLPGETLRRRWANGEDTVASGPVRSRAPAAGVPKNRVAVATPVLPPPPRPAAAPPPVPWVLSRPTPVPPVLTAKPARSAKPRRGGGAAPVLQLQSGCSGQFQLDGMAVDAMGRPCFGGS